MENSLTVSRDGAITTILLNKPDEENRFSPDMLIELAEIVRTESASQGLLVLRGAGGNFCAGLASRGKPPAEAHDFRTGFDPVFDLHDVFRRCRAQILGVVEGKAIGFGCSLMSVCDIVIAADTARFCLPETAHGILPTAALSRMIGQIPDKRLSYLTVSAEEFSAEQAFAAGLLSRVVKADALDTEISAFVEKAKRIPIAVLRATKEFIGAPAITRDAQSVAFARNLHATVNAYSQNRVAKS